MKLVEVVILLGSQCLSPVQSGDGVTDVGKVSCAVLIRQDPQTADVEIIPPSAATDPDVIAALVKPRTHSIVPTAAEDVTGGIVAPWPVPETGMPGKVIEASAETLEEVPLPKPRPAVSVQKQKPVAARAKRVAKRADSCGSYRAVWYTNKEGRRRYRCVKAG